MIHVWFLYTCALDQRTEFSMIHFRRKNNSFYVILKRKIVSAGIRTSNPWVDEELSTAELFDLLITGHTISVYQLPIPLFTNQSTVHTSSKITKCEQFRTQCCLKITATLILETEDIVLIEMWQECYIRRETWLPWSIELKSWLHVTIKSTKHVTSINGYIISFIIFLATYMWNIIKIGSLLTCKKHSAVTKGC